MGKMLQIELSDRDAERLDDVTRSGKQSVTEVVQESVRRYLISVELREIRKVLVPLAQAQGIYTDEDVFRLMS